MTTLSYNNFSGGYTTQQARFTEKIQQLVRPSQNIDIIPLEEGGFGISKIAGNAELFHITGKSIKNLFTYDNGTDDYLLAHTGTSVYEYNEETGATTAIKTGLTSTDKSSFANISVAEIDGDIFHMGFFCNGVDSPFIYIKGNSPEVQTITAVDENGNVIKSHICIAFDGRIWMFADNVVHWSKQQDPFTWGVPVDCGFQPLDADIIAAKIYAGAIEVHTANGIKIITPLTDGTYTFTDASSSYALNYKALCNHDNSSIFLANDGIYPIEVTQQGVRRTDNSLSYMIDSDLQAFGKSTLANAQMFNVTVAGRNETWLHIPESTRSTVYIFRWSKGNQDAYFLPPRVQQSITCLHVFKDYILSGTSDGKVLQELKGKTFNGATIVAKAKPAKIILANSSGTQKFKPVLYMDNLYNNNFYVDTILNGDTTNAKESELIKDNTSSGIWGESLWGDVYWATASLNAVKIPKVKTKGKRAESSIQFVFKTKNATDDFSIHRIELTKVRRKTK